ncbi:MAG: winged helix-turn-helix transcriptional regulator [Lachnospiraceae bacterium]|nr:winged helix-turn-helix transcriptional regulator [Lachnospiraceae bacterium]
MTDREREIYELIAENPMISQEELAKKTGISRSSVAVHISNLMRKGFIIGKGYVMQQPGHITVFGAANIDIGGKPFNSLVQKDSNPGQVRTSLGGVGRNIAYNLSLLGNSVKFISAFGDDSYAKLIQDSCRQMGIDTHDSIVSKEDATSTYLFITGDDGDMELAINDMEIYRHMTPEFIKGKLDVLNHSKLVIVDANLPEETIEAICTQSKAPVIAETVSRAKAVRFKKVLSYIDTITPNHIEAEILTGLSIDPDSEDSLKKAADVFLSEGVKHIIITLGSNGAYFSDGKIYKKVLPLPSKMINGNGAGDALLSGVATGFAKGMSFENAVKLGMASASITLETAQTNNPDLCFEAAKKRAKIKGV